MTPDEIPVPAKLEAPKRVRIVQGDGPVPDPEVLNEALEEMAQNDKLSAPRIVQIFVNPGRFEPVWTAVLSHG